MTSSSSRDQNYYLIIIERLSFALDASNTRATNIIWIYLMFPRYETLTSIWDYEKVQSLILTN